MVERMTATRQRHGARLVHSGVARAAAPTARRVLAGGVLAGRVLAGGVLAGGVLAGCGSGGGGSAEGGDGNRSVAGAGGRAAPGAVQGDTSDPASDGAPTAPPEALDPGSIANVAGAGPGPRAAPGGAAAPSSGCGGLPLLGAGEQTLEVGGVARGYVLDVPPGYDGAEPLPLVFAFHGATTSGALFRSAFYGNLLSAMGDAAIVVHPDALGEPSAWDSQADLPFFDALLAELAAGLCVDEARVFATGHSSGGFFTNTLGCQRGEVLRAIAPVSGGGPFGFGGGCSGEVAVWLAHADNDQVVPFDSGLASRDRWLSANACSEQSVAVEPSPCVEYGGCSAGSPVRWCVYQDGHDWPDFGPEGIWGFFSSF